MITITEAAQQKIAEVLAEENDPKTRLRMYVQGGGCSGFQYGFTIDDEQNEDDFEIPAGSSSVLVDSMSIQYLQGAVVDYKDDLEGSRFSISNPVATSTCGCGSSFSV
ncbi:MAG: iron-sulfur cluster insertion protein ErpA [Sediminibacterium sp.]|nr:iron-sulfur cluster insertion protein ErpA [Sediminibacterium sp.]